MGSHQVSVGEETSTGTMLYLRSLLLSSLLVSSAVSRIRNSPIHFVKLNNYGAGIDLRSERNLAEIFAEKRRKKESERSFKGRKVLNFGSNSIEGNIQYGPSKYPDKYFGMNGKDKISDNEILQPANNIPYSPSNYPHKYIGINKKDKNSDNKISKPVNIIPYNPSKYPSNNLGINMKDKLTPNEIFRPDLSFISNARPAMLKWRELEVKKTQIIKPPDKKKYKSRWNKKYSSKVPVHLGYSRKFVEYPEPPPLETFQKLFPKYPGSTVTWLPATRFVNGLPKMIYHMKYPVKTRKFNYIDNYGAKDTKHNYKYDDDAIKHVDNYL